MKTFTPPTFSKDDTRSYKEYLAREGYVVISGILDEATRQRLIGKFWQAWTEVSPRFDKNDKNTWTIENSCMMFSKGMAVYNGLPHSEFMWELRMQRDIIDIFASIHNTNDLVTSFDGFSVFYDPKQKTKPWWHIDQHPNNPMYCVQGAYNFLPVREDSSGFIVIPRSHMTRRAPNPKYKGDWMPLDSGRGGVKLIIPENCLLLWHSRTVHANTGINCREKRFDRLTCYITFLPKSQRTEEVRRKKIQAYKNGEGTSHWATRCEVKKYPWGFGPQYTARNFKKILPAPEIPVERLNLI